MALVQVIWNSNKGKYPEAVSTAKPAVPEKSASSETRAEICSVV